MNKYCEKYNLIHCIFCITGAGFSNICAVEKWMQKLDKVKYDKNKLISYLEETYSTNETITSDIKSAIQELNDPDLISTYNKIFLLK